MVKILYSYVGALALILPLKAWSAPDIEVVKPLNVNRNEVNQIKLPDSQLADLNNLKQLASDNARKEVDQVKQAIEDNNKLLNEIAKSSAKDEADILRQIARDKDGLAPLREIVMGDMYYILISSSMRENEIQDILEASQGMKDITLVIQGFKHKESLIIEINQWHKLIAKFKKPINFQIDPTMFEKYKISVIPTTIHEKDGKLVAIVKGISNPGFLAGKHGDLGTQGPTLPIAEQNMLNMIHDGLQNLNFEEMKKNAVKRYWKNQTIYPFPTATKSTVHYVDPSVVIPHDIVSPDGKIIAKKGLINPMDVMPFNLKLIFFNPNDQWQRELAKQQYTDTKKQRLQPFLIATDIYENGWETFQDNEFYGEGATLYFIQPGMRDRFGIERVPSVVTGDGKRFVIHEYAKAKLQETQNEKN